MRASPASGAAADPPAAAPDPVVEEYLAYLEFERTLSPNTVAAYRRDLERFAAWLAGRSAADQAVEAGRKAEPRSPRATVLEATEDDLYHYFAGGGGDGATTSVARRMAAVRGLYHYLVREKSLAADPAARLTPPRHPHGLPRVLDVEEIAKVLGGVPLEGPLAERDLALFELLY
ncbi:MAG: site-specific integrase, partial [Thermoleophilia bacterium]